MNTRCKSSECIHVLIADSDFIRKQLLARELQRHSGFKVTSCDNEISACRSAIDESPVDVLLWAESSQCDAKQVFSGIRDALVSRPLIRCIALLESWERERVLSAFHAGARGLFSLDQGSLGELRKCILCVHRDQVWASSPQILALLEAFRRSPVVRVMNVKGKNLLTPRQQELVELVAEGMGNREVAQCLHVTENTVKKSMLRIFDKVGVSNRVELVLAALAFKDSQSERVVRIPPAKESLVTGDLFGKPADAKVKDASMTRFIPISK